MRIATNLADLSGLGAYVLHPDNDDAHFLKRCIDLFHPSASFGGFVGDLGDRGATSVITVDARWPLALPNSIAPANLIVFPAVDTVGWSFWHFGREIIDQIVPGAPGTPAKLPFAAFAKILSNWEPPILEIAADNNVKLLNGEDFYTWHTQERQAFQTPIGFVHGQLANDDSKNAYALAIQGNPVDVWRHYVAGLFSKTQYLQYVTLQPGSVVLDVGIDDGFEIPYLTAHLQGRGQIYCIDPFGFEFLSRAAWQNIGCFQSMVQQQRIAIANFNGSAKIPFGGTRAFGDAINRVPEGTQHLTVPCGTIDDLVFGSNLPRLDFIKVNAEGAEDIMIEGMRGSVAKHRPQLAITISHAYPHHWSIPMRLMCLCPDYVYFADHYGAKKWDTVFYAIPREKVQPTSMRPVTPLLVLN